MSHLARLRRPAGAMGLSALTVGLAVILQASWFFRAEVSDAVQRPSAIKQLAIGNGGQWAIASVLNYPPNDLSRPQQGLWLCHLGSSPQETHELHLDAVPARVACAAEGNVGFVAAERGRLYSIDLSCEPPALHHLGEYRGHYPLSIVCSRDGSRLVVAADSLVAWSDPDRARLWERTDILATDCCFGPREDRLYCSLKEGGILELNASTGVTLQRFDCGAAQVQKLAMSPCGEWLACVEADCYRRLDVRTGEIRWQVPCAAPLKPQFVGYSGELLLANLLAGPALSLVDPASGRTVAEYPLEGDLSGLTVVGPDAVYTWAGSQFRQLDLPTGRTRSLARL
jgi:hypothetical protein